MEAHGLRSQNEIELESLLDNFQDIRSSLYRQEVDLLRNGITIKIKPINIFLFLFKSDTSPFTIIKEVTDLRNCTGKIALFQDENYAFQLKHKESVVLTGTIIDGKDEIHLVPHSFFLKMIFSQHLLWFSLFILGFFGTIGFEFKLKSSNGDLRKFSELKSGFHNTSLYLEEKFKIAKEGLSAVTSLLRYSPEYRAAHGIIFYSKDFRWHYQELWETRDVEEVLMILKYSYKVFFKNKDVGFNEAKLLWKQEYNKKLKTYYRHKNLLDKGVF